MTGSKFPRLLLAIVCATGCARTHAGLLQDKKAEYSAIFSEALRDGDMTTTQYEEALQWLDASPCDNIDRTVDATQAKGVISALSRHRRSVPLEVTESLAFGGWTISHVSLQNLEPAYYFFSGPLPSAPVATWSGAATILETGLVQSQVLDNAPGIPHELAECFAWHITLELR